jgi:hypothetical protein
MTERVRFSPRAGANAESISPSEALPAVRAALTLPLATLLELLGSEEATHRIAVALSSIDGASPTP